MESVIPSVLFWTGVVSSGLLLATSIFGGGGDDKRGWVAFPFLALAAAAVAKYLGL